MHKIITIDEENIKNKIFTIRGLQVMLDRDLAELYEIETKVFNQAVKRNENRFPDDFRFQLSEAEKNELVTNCDRFNSQNSLRSQSVTLESNRGKHTKYLPYAFTEQGVFYDGEVYDAYLFVSNLIKSAKKSIVLVDNYLDESVLTMLSKRQPNVTATIYTKNITAQLELDIKKHNTQYPKITLKKFDSSHDRFLIIDGKELYHIGASLKDLGKKWFAFSKFDMESFDILKRLEG